MVVGVLIIPSSGKVRILSVGNGVPYVPVVSFGAKSEVSTSFDLVTIYGEDREFGTLLLLTLELVK